jgi:hypothetical protein
MIDFVCGGHGWMSVGVDFRQRSILKQRMRRQRCGLHARGQRGGACGKSKGDFQKMAAFHDISLSWMASDAKRIFAEGR